VRNLLAGFVLPHCLRTASLIALSRDISFPFSVCPSFSCTRSPWPPSFVHHNAIRSHSRGLTPIRPIAPTLFLGTASGLHLSSSASLPTLAFIYNAHPPAGSRSHFVTAALPAPAPALPPPGAQSALDCQCRSLPSLGSGRLPVCGSCRSYLLSGVLYQRLTCPAIFCLSL
jgi:hypothetical protein